MNLALLTKTGSELRTRSGALVYTGVTPRPAAPFVYPVQPVVPLARPDSVEDRLGRPVRTMSGALLLQGCLPLPATRLLISGVTKDSTGAVLAACSVSLYRTSDKVFLELVVSDGSGAYSFSSVGLGETYYVVAYKAGSPDVAGTTINTLVGVIS